MWLLQLACWLVVESYDLNRSLIVRNNSAIAEKVFSVGISFLHLLLNTHYYGKKIFNSRHKKISKVINKFKEGKLKSSAGDKVTNRKQAIAI